MEKMRHRMRRYWYLPAIIVVVGAALAWLSIGASVSLPAPLSAVADVKKVLWDSRQTDLIGQIIVIFTGVFGVIVLFKERKT